MKRVAGLLSIGIAITLASTSGRAQDKPPGPPAAPPLTPAQLNDPRVKLKAGMEDAGSVAWNLELVGHMPKPDGFGGVTPAVMTQRFWTAVDRIA